jgi:hypothetical protein
LREGSRACVRGPVDLDVSWERRRPRRHVVDVNGATTAGVAAGAPRIRQRPTRSFSRRLPKAVRPGGAEGLLEDGSGECEVMRKRQRKPPQHHHEPVQPAESLALPGGRQGHADEGPAGTRRSHGNGI